MTVAKGEKAEEIDGEIDLLDRLVKFLLAEGYLVDILSGSEMPPVPGMVDPDDRVGILALGLDVRMIIGFPLGHFHEYLVLCIPACPGIPEDFPGILYIRDRIDKESIIKEIPEAGS